MDLIAELAEKVILLDRGKLLAFCGKKELFKETNQIKALGLDFPQVLELVRKLKEKGIRIEREVFTEEELLAIFES
jgi:energy-coupling factor transport system ATP-binding protein